MNKHYLETQNQQIMKEVTETGNLTLVAEKHGISKSTVASWVSRKQPHNIEKHKQKSELKNLKKKLADAELKNKVLTELKKNIPSLAQRLEVCSEVFKENSKVNKVKLFQYAGVKRSTFYSQKEKGLPIEPMGSKGRRPPEYSTSSIYPVRKQISL